MTLTEELSLVRAAQNGDRSALGALWDAITPKLYGYLVNTLKNNELAEDCLQETWLKAVGALPRFRPRNIRFSAWLFAIARNVCREQWRRTKHEFQVNEVSAEPSDQAHEQESLETKLYLEKIIDELDTDDQELLRLRFVADLSFQDIARILTISPLSARVRLHRTLKRARAILNHP